MPKQFCYFRHPIKCPSFTRPEAFVYVHVLRIDLPNKHSCEYVGRIIKSSML